MIRVYFETLRTLMGQQYPTALALLFFGLETLLVLQQKKKADDRYLLLAGVIGCMTLPLYYGYLVVLHVPRGTSAVAYQILPGILVASYGLTVTGIALVKRLGKKAWAIIAVVVLVVASQPWAYTLNHFHPSALRRAKVDPEVYELAELMGAGKAFMPTDIASQFCEIQSETDVCFGDGYDLTKTEIMDDMVAAILEYRMDYMVCPREADNAEWFALYGYAPIGETAHYILYGADLTQP